MDLGFFEGMKKTLDTSSYEGDEKNGGPEPVRCKILVTIPIIPE